MTENSERCFACAPILGRLVKAHGANACPLVRSRYCGMCASYGHTPSNCPDVTTRNFREPQFMEQLIPPSLIEKHKINTLTHLKSVKVATEAPKDWLLEVPDTDEGLRAALIAAGVKPMICQAQGKKENREITENKQRLQNVATAAGRKLVFIPDPSRDDKEQTTAGQNQKGEGAATQQQQETKPKKAARRSE